MFRLDISDARAFVRFGDGWSLGWVGAPSSTLHARIEVYVPRVSAHPPEAAFAGLVPPPPSPPMVMEIEQADVRPLPGRFDWGELRRRVRCDGVLIFRAPCAAGDRAAVEQLLLGISEQFGEIALQDARGTRLREVRDAGSRIGEGATSRYADSRQGGSFHTDGAEASLPPPEYFALGCVRQAPVGGALQLIALDQVLDLLDRHSDVLDTLRRPFHFDRRGDSRPGEPGTVWKPVLFMWCSETCVTYLREYILAGHRRPEVPKLTSAQAHALAKLDDVLERKAAPRLCKLRPGDVAIVDNLHHLHARTSFIDRPGRPRLLLRTWITNASDALRSGGTDAAGG